MSVTSTIMQHNSDEKEVDNLSTNTKVEPQKYRWKILWLNVFTFIILHSIVFYGIYIILCGRVQLKTLICALAVHCCNGIGVTAGAHRLWAHRTYKARFPLRVLLAAFQTMAYQYSIFKWVSDHRVHHKYTDTDADPYRGPRLLLLAHRLAADPQAPGRRRHVPQRGHDRRGGRPGGGVAKKTLRMAWTFDDLLYAAYDPIFVLERNFFYSFVVVGVLRYVFVLHATFLVNSAAHVWGTKPYDKNITPTENPSVSLVAFGEGWHNYHHTFPWDYKAAELGNYRLNLTTAFIDACAYLGLAYDLKTSDPILVSKRSKRTGDALR